MRILAGFTNLRIFSLFYTWLGTHVNDIFEKLSFSDMNLVTLSDNYLPNDGTFEKTLNCRTQ